MEKRRQRNPARERLVSDRHDSLVVSSDLRSCAGFSKEVENDGEDKGEGERDECDPCPDSECEDNAQWDEVASTVGYDPRGEVEGQGESDGFEGI